MRESTWKGLNEVFRRELDVEDLELRPEMTANDVEGWDSITHVMIVVAVEKKFSVKFAAAEIQKLKNVGELAALVESKLA